MIKLYGWVFKVIEVPSNILDGNVWGDIIYKEQLIRLDAALNKTLKRQTLIHELVHALQFYMGYGENMSKEDMCNFVAAHLDNISTAVNDYFYREEEA